MNRIIPGLVITAALAGCSSSPVTLAPDPHPGVFRPIATYSIVARDPRSGQMGVAVQSHWFSVGSVVPWAESGVGAVATQSLVDPAYGKLGLDLMRIGRSAPAALASMLAGDDGREYRQVAMIDASGTVAAHTGELCIAGAGHIIDAENQFSVQANLMLNDEVWGAMHQAYLATDGDLADRMVAALEAAQSVGGDIRGKQSAALLIVAAEPTGQSWSDRLFDLRIEDHPEPVKELKRLVLLQRAYQHMNAGDLAMEHNDFEAALREYSAARQLAPQIVEIPFWTAVTMAGSGRVNESLPIFREVFLMEPIWAELVPRLVKSKLLPDDNEMIRRILEQR
jgi:uncharacterized Ntn-hydrolase superfamily protein